MAVLSTSLSSVMNLEQLVAEVLHELPFAFAVLSFMIYSSFVFWFECWRYNYIAALFVCYAVHLIVSSQPPSVPNPFGHDNVEGDTSITTAPPSVHQMIDFYWREAVQNYQMYEPWTDHQADELAGNLGHIRGPLPFPYSTCPFLWLY